MTISSGVIIGQAINFVGMPVIGRLYAPEDIMVELYENRCISKCDYVIAATPHIADRCRKHNKNTTVIANYPIISKEKEEDSCKTCVSLQNPKEHDLDSINLCYCGGMPEARNISMYVKAMECAEKNT